MPEPAPRPTLDARAQTPPSRPIPPISEVRRFLAAYRRRALDSATARRRKV
jgi:hypothetical protein